MGWCWRVGLSHQWIVWVLATAPLVWADASGRYVDAEGGGTLLVLEETAAGVVSGSLSESGWVTSLRGTREGDWIRGTLGSGAQSVMFSMMIQADRLQLDVAGEVASFVREGKPQGAAPPPAATRSRPAVQRNVRFNGLVYSAEELAAIERAWNIRIPDADYWYDPVLGAWGVRGSPTLGFLPPGLQLGGRLAADASGGGTTVVVNGRVLHPHDLVRLQQITGPIQPGRYFITAQGLAGFEGGPALWNLAAAMSAAGGGNPTGTWQSRLTGASGFSDGTTGAVFLPNGGIVSTGQ
jgi:hypothetical protein